MPSTITIKGFLSFFILHELSKKELSGEDLAKKIGARQNKILTPGTIYPTLKKLKKKKLLVWKRDGRKKMYSLTPQGKSELKRLYKELNIYFKGLKKIF